MVDKPSQEISIRVRYHEVDQMGVLHHSRYLTYFEIGRTELLRKSGYTYREFEDNRLYLVIVQAECKFKYPVRYDQIVCLQTTLERITPAKIIHTYQLWNEDKTWLHATGQTTLACVNGQGEIERIPPFLIELVEKS